MSIFELTARHQMNLGNNNIIPKGEKLRLNIHTMGVQPYNIFSNPENRRQAIQQFSVNGININSNSPFLNTGHWEIKRVPEAYFHKITETGTPLENLSGIENIFRAENKVINDVDMKKNCISLTKNFFAEGLDLKFSDKGLEGRCEIICDYFNGVKNEMGIETDIQFKHMPPNKLGGYNPATNSIELNYIFLENSDCEDLLNTILHESRHAFQEKCISNPDSVSVKNNIIDVWKDNFSNYISPEYDFEAYENQEIEKDANYFADSVIKKSLNYNYV